MKLLSIITFILLLVGCSGEQMAHDITKSQIAMSANKPPAKYRVANLQTMKDYVFETKYFSFKFPTAKKTDFTKMGGWWGASHRDGKTITSHLSPVYHMTVSTPLSPYEYTEREKAIFNNNISYLRKRMPKRITQQGEIHNITLKTTHMGKENYSCIVRESSYPKYNRRQISYGCYKLNSNNTKVIKVSITATYNKSSNLTLAKQYTYQDLKRRAKRTLDSLYIKDGW